MNCSKQVSVWACSLLSLAEYKYRIEQNMASTSYFEQGKNRLNVVFDENAFDEITFRRTGNLTKTFDEVSQWTNCRSTKCRLTKCRAPKVNVLNLKYELNLVKNIHDLLCQGMGGPLMAHQSIECLVGLYGIEFV